MVEGQPESLNPPHTQWERLAEKYGQNVLAQRHILWPGIFSKIIIPPHAKILNVGSGDGAYAAAFQCQGADVTAIEPSEEFMKFATERHVGPDYINTTFSDYRPAAAEEFELIFANMLVCNFDSEKKLQEFFTKSAQLSTGDAVLYVTNVSPDFQTDYTSPYLTHRYPSGVDEGVTFKVLLGLCDGGSIGPFDNYHWSKTKVIECAQKAGWELVEETVLAAQESDVSLAPTYSLYSFKKNT